MSARFCSFCGQPLPGQGTFCPSCGAAVSGAPAPGSGPSPLPTFLPPAGYYPVPGPATPGPVGPAPATQREDLAALSHVTIAAILSLVGVIVGIVTSTISNVSGIVTSSTGTSGVSISLPSPWVWVGLVGISVAIEIAGLVMFRSAFRTLARVDRRFSTPAMLALAAIASFVVILLGLGLLLGALYQAVQCVGSGNPITGACLFTGTFWAGIALLVVGGLVALVGFIGVLIGIWRLGTRYSETTFKLGAVLSIIPYLNIAGAILILAGAHSVRGRLERTGAPSPPSAPWR